MTFVDLFECCNRKASKHRSIKWARSERGLSVIREWPFFGSVTREKRKI